MQDSRDGSPSGENVGVTSRGGVAREGGGSFGRVEWEEGRSGDHIPGIPRSAAECGVETTPHLIPRDDSRNGSPSDDARDRSPSGEHITTGGTGEHARASSEWTPHLLPQDDSRHESPSREHVRASSGGADVRATRRGGGDDSSDGSLSGEHITTGGTGLRLGEHVRASRGEGDVTSSRSIPRSPIERGVT